MNGHVVREYMAGEYMPGEYMPGEYTTYELLPYVMHDLYAGSICMIYARSDV
jgi:hypothetical protein